MKNVLIKLGWAGCMLVSINNCYAFYDNSPLEDASPQVDYFSKNIVTFSNGDGSKFCSGIIVGDDKILTAAHCFFDDAAITVPRPQLSKHRKRSINPILTNQYREVL
jgi:hypothetical protein